MGYITNIAPRKQFPKKVSHKLHSIFNQNTNEIWQVAIKMYMVK